MNWTDNKTLLNYLKYTPCSDIFQAVCDEIGKYYVAQYGFKYARSRPKITFKNKDFKLDIAFWSSRSNISGNYVNLEIIPMFYDLNAPKNHPSKGLLFTHGAILYHKYTNDIQRIRHVHVFGEVEEFILDYSYESVIKDVNMCNIYGLDETKFNKIIAFLDTKIIVWLEKIKTKKGILELIKNPCDTQLRDIKNGYLIEYIKLNFPNVNIENLESEQNL
jgi:hypothetical protein